MQTFTLEIDDAPNLRFAGELIASAATSDNNAMGRHYSGAAGEWTELQLYKTKAGRFVCHRIERTRWQGARDRYAGKVCDTAAGVGGFFGNGWLAKELYSAAGIDAGAVDVE